MKQILLIFHIVFAVVMMLLILLQSSHGGLSRSFGSGDLYRSKRGAEKIVFIATIASAALFFITSVFTLFV